MAGSFRQTRVSRAKRSPSANPLRQLIQLWPADRLINLTEDPRLSRAATTRSLLPRSHSRVPHSRYHSREGTSSSRTWDRNHSPPAKGLDLSMSGEKRKAPDWATTFWNRSDLSQASWELSNPPRLAPQATRRPSQSIRERDSLESIALQNRGFRSKIPCPRTRANINESTRSLRLLLKLRHP